MFVAFSTQNKGKLSTEQVQAPAKHPDIMKFIAGGCCNDELKRSTDGRRDGHSGRVQACHDTLRTLFNTTLQCLHAPLSSLSLWFPFSYRLTPSSHSSTSNYKPTPISLGAHQPITQPSSASYTQLSYASLTPLISPFTPPAPPLTLAGRCCPQTPGGSCSRASVKGGCILTLARSHARAQTSAVIHTRRRHSGVQASAH